MNRHLPRVALLVIFVLIPFCTGGSSSAAKKTLRVMTDNIHVDYQFANGRLFETEQLLEMLEDVKGPLIVVADFNDVPEGSAYKLMDTRFDDAWIVSRAKGDGFSYPADKPVKRIDHIFYRSGEGVHAKRAWVVETLASDHMPVMAEIELI